MDLSNPRWHQFLIDKVIAPLSRQGYAGIFLDTLDSYQMVVHGSKQQRQQQGLVQFVTKVHQHFPKLKMILNRGFEVVTDVHAMIHGVVAESLFRTWNPKTGRYHRVAQADQQWLAHRLTEIKQSFHLPIYVIDYVPTNDRVLARATARQISQLGFSPWVSNPAMDMLGVSTIEIAPRRILLLYDGQEGEIAYSEAHRFLAAPLEYLGFVIDYRDVREALPAETVRGRYAGVVAWFSDDTMKYPRRYMRWLRKQIHDGVKVALLHSFGMKPSKAFLKLLGLQEVDGKIKKPIHIVHRDHMAQMEARPRPLKRGLMPVHSISAENQVHEQIVDQRGKTMDVIVTGKWGGVALAPYVVEHEIDEHARWRLDIFSFLQTALQLPAMPRFDTTTENGARLLMTHIDGDGAASYAEMPGSPLAIQVIRDQVLKKYRLPATVSVITSEFESQGLYPKRAPAMQRIARTIFRLPYVEIASHTYSHPFDWWEAEHGLVSQRHAHAYLPIPGYQFSLRQEIVGSVDFINRELAPKHKRVKVMLWSGNALPSERAIAMADQQGLRNLNGGNTVVTRDNRSLTDVSSMFRPVGQRIQVYAPTMNENIYTNNWTKPFYGFRRVIETFKLTESPRRLKPIDIYYHFYSGSKFASLAALQHVYDWSLKQDTLPIWVSEYADKVIAYTRAVVARTADGTWLLQAPAALRTVRLDRALGWPDLRTSQGVIGVRDVKQGRYLHLSPAGRLGRYRLRLVSHKPHTAYLVRANAIVDQWHARSGAITVRMHGAVPIEMSMNRACHIRFAGRDVAAVKRGSFYHLALHVKDTGHAVLTCR